MSDYTDAQQVDDAAESSIHDQVDQQSRRVRSVDGFLPGAIRRIALYNFLTYDSVEFNVGPYLNMICGPNGTGKSSIACAIALGLGGTPAVLGRAKTVSSFVKAGKTDAWIEIQLQGWSNARNRTVRRTLSAENNKSDWFLDGRATTQKDVVQVVAEYNIDVANLCSFLPQDKVAEFARMTDAKRLLETEKAAGGTKLVRSHQKLIDLGRSASQLVEKLKEKHEAKSHLEQRNQALEVDVQRFEERKQIQERIEILNVKIAIAEYGRIKRDLARLMQQRNDKKEELRQAHVRGEPVRQRLDELGDKSEKVKLELQRLESTEKSDDQKRRKLVARVAELGKEIEDRLDVISTLSKTEETRKARIQRIRAEIQQRIADAAGREPPQQDVSDLNAQVTELRRQERELHSQRVDITQRKQDISLENTAIARSLNASRQRLAGLDNVREQRLAALRSADEHVFQATQWLRDPANQARFQKPVYEPILLEIQLKDTKYAAAVESCIPFVVQKTFVCQTRADYDLFTRELLDKMKLRITVAEVEGIAPEVMRPPLPRHELEAYGFEGFVIDFIEGPRDILVYLCRQSHVQRIPVSLNSNIDVERIEESGKFMRFVIGRQNFTINTSRYGADARQTMSRELKPARSLVHSVNRELQQRLNAEIQEQVAKRHELEAQTARAMEQDNEIRKKIEKIAAQVQQVKREKDERAGARREWEKNASLLAMRKRDLRAEEDVPSVEEQRAREMKAVRHLVVKRNEKVQDLQATVVALSQVLERKHRASLSKWQWDATDAHLQNLVKDIDEAERALAEECEQAILRVREARETARAVSQRVQEQIDRASELVADLDPNDDEAFDLEQCSAELRAETSKLEMAEGVRPELIQAYEARRAQIATLTSEVGELLELQADLESKIASIRGRWEPALRRVVAEVSKRFSRAFDELGLAGELRIVEDADYEKWKLEIMVKFRNSEELAPLSGHHQSGGEKALSTIMYVMSLLQLSRSPFTLVDEINQGMDSLAERAAHNHIVSITCTPDSSQYFLITPKLLPDLRSHPLQKVLLVNNGEWIQERFNFASVIGKRKRTLGFEPDQRLRTVQRVMESVTF
ncbi:P-loop containing nucleoside triphosphate hydrolase protein [Testicularia cyperi]|uniref:Structural maintenance of chromosomes protein 5 n=1 Tax=Testicularia cyperi TaxID=1882483 RepID=A0A317XIS3_9BASI|nr:P-loop containing nucleoside triphosphate hydrolase protein [Testicularia cyperi]DBA11458.1 TPA_inf: SMC5 [Testicularia cyperi]